MAERSIVKPAFHVGPSVPPLLHIGRDQQLRDAQETLLEPRGNLLVVGRRKIGKTSLVRKLKDVLEDQRVLCVEVNLVAYEHDPKSFLREVLLQICYDVGKRAFGKSASDLLLTLGSDPPTVQDDWHRFLMVYQLARPISITHRTSRSIDGHIKLPIVVEGGGSLDREREFDVGDVYQIEFIRLVLELMDICRNKGIESIVVIADEANRLAAQVSKDLLQAYFDTFASGKVQFVFVADVSLLDYGNIEDLFALTLKLSPFREDKSVHELLDRYYKQLEVSYTSVFTEGAVKRLWELSRGHPYLLQLLCSSAIDEAEEKQQLIVRPDDVQARWDKALIANHRLIEFWE